jgi:hypothetical protein
MNPIGRRTAMLGILVLAIVWQVARVAVGLHKGK